MHITLCTLFPAMFRGPFDESILKRAQKKNIFTISYVNIRDFAYDARGSVDDHPYGGGGGMIIRVDVVDKVLDFAKNSHKFGDTLTVLLDPKGNLFTQEIASKLSGHEHIILFCGHYEGIDDRAKSFFDCTISVGDFIVTGGEIPAMLLVDAVTRLLPGTLKNDNTTKEESFSLTDEKNLSAHLLEYPQYTQPQVYKNMKVPEILLSGDHKRINAWRKAKALEVTKDRRPDLLK